METADTLRPELAFLRAHSAVPPRAHGNGFIQLDLRDGRRLHVWGDPRIPRQRVMTPVHDHLFGFRSQCVVGRIFNLVYERDIHREGPGQNTHDVWEVRPEGRADGTENTVLMPAGSRTRADGMVALTDTKVSWRMVVGHVELTEAGQSYDLSPLIFHESTTDRPSATVMVKTGRVRDHRPRVLVPLGLEPDNAFSRDDHDVDLLWRIIEEVLR